MRKARVFIAICALAAVGGSEARPLTTGADFLLVTTGARPDALGQAFSAVADDINTLSFNPAGLGNIRLPEVGYGRYQFVADIHFDFIGLALLLGNPGVLGLGFIGMGTPPFNSTADPTAAKVDASENALILGWGRSYERIHAGASLKYISRHIGSMTGSGVLMDLGGRYRFTPRVTFAASMLNFGPRVRLEEKEDTPAILKFGSAFRLLDHPFHSVDLSMDASVPWVSLKPRYGWGTEYWYKGLVAGRVGFIGNTVDEGFTTGGGVNVKGFQIDYAFQPFNRLGVTHRFSGLYRWHGNWLAGNEPNPPRNVRVTESGRVALLGWERPIGPYTSFEVAFKPLERDKVIVVPNVPESPVRLKGLRYNTLYRITVRTVGKGGRRSYPSKPIVYEYVPEEEPKPATEDAAPEPAGSGTDSPAEPVPMATPTRAWVPEATPLPLGAGRVEGRVDMVGLHLRWDPVPGSETAGYNIYMKRPDGRIEKVNLEPKKDTDVWVSPPEAQAGSKWFVTALTGVEGEEFTVGSYRWKPTREEMDLLLRDPALRLKVSPQASARFFLDWDTDPGASNYSLFVAKEDDVYEWYGYLDRLKPWVLLSATESGARFRFIVLSHGADGAWLNRTRVDSGRILVVTDGIRPPTGE
jgi:hypothetical protein